MNRSSITSADIAMDDSRPTKRARQACEPCRSVSHVTQLVPVLIMATVARSLSALGRSPCAHTANVSVKYASMNQALMARVKELGRIDHWCVTNWTLHLPAADMRCLQELRMETLEEKLDLFIDRLE